MNPARTASMKAGPARRTGMLWCRSASCRDQASQRLVWIPVPAAAACDLFPFVFLLRMTLIELPINRRDLSDPTPPLVVLQVHNGLEWPMKVIGDKGYLLVQTLEGIA